TAFPPHPPLPGTAICADIYHPGPALPRQQCGDGGAEHVQANGWKAFIQRVNTKAKRWQAQIHRYYLARMHKHVAPTTKRAFRFVRLIAFIIHLSRKMLFRETALPFGVLTQVVHDRRFALFRRRPWIKHSGCWHTTTFASIPVFG